MCGGLRQGAQISILESHLSILPTEFPHMLKISSLHVFLTPLTPTTFMFLFNYHCEISPSPPACQVGLKSSLSLLWTSAEPSQSGLPAFTSINFVSGPVQSNSVWTKHVTATKIRQNCVSCYNHVTCIFFSFVELCIVNLLKITFFQYF